VVRVSARAGLAQYPQDGEHADELIHHALVNAFALNSSGASAVAQA